MEEPQDDKDKKKMILLQELFKIVYVLRQFHFLLMND